jgi:hypothetical protein
LDASSIALNTTIVSRRCGDLPRVSEQAALAQELRIHKFFLVPQSFDKSHILNTVAGLIVKYAEYDISRAPDARERAKAGP